MILTTSWDDGHPLDWRLADLPFVFRRNTHSIVDLTRRWLERAMERGGVLHVWGHSWEIDRYGMWAELEAVLALVAGTKGRALWLTSEELYAECAAGVLPESGVTHVP